MLLELRIRDFAIIDRLELTFQSGLVAFTGETGAGKSIIFDAIETLLGGRVDASLVRSGASQAQVEATFQVEAAVRPQVTEILNREELLDDDGEYLTLSRELRQGGRSVARVNGRMVNVSLLRELGEYLVDLHGQSEHLSLLRTSEHLGLLDRYAGVDKPLAAYVQTYRKLQVLRGEIKSLQRSEQDQHRRIELLRFQAEEIEGARLKAGEESELRAEQTRLANAEGLARLAQEAIQLLDEGNPEAPAASDLLGQVVHAMQALARLDPAQAARREQAESAFETISELARSLRGYAEEIEFNPRRLDQVEERLNLFHNLKRKYGASLEEVIAYGIKVRQELETIQQSGERLAELQAEEETLLRTLAEQALALSAARQKAAEKMARAIQTELDDLRMAGAQFQVAFNRRPDAHGLPVEGNQRVAFDANGLEQIEFLIAPNQGEGFKPLVKIASGGETSRLMLALKNVLARADHVPTLIFDEIDQGIGGRVGIIVGQKLWNLGRQHQVLCITHLPQLAAFGDQHFHVQKLLANGRTATQVEMLEGEKRLRELALMFGEVSAGTLRSAEEILQVAHNMRQAG